MSREQKTFLLLQVNDALFPIGGYSHSYGLETYIQNGLVTDGNTAAVYIRQNLLCSFCSGDLLAAKLAYEYAAEGDLERIAELEEVIEASKIPSEIRSAGKKLGSRFLKTLMSMGVSGETGIFRKYAEVSGARKGYHPAAYGVFCAAYEIPKKEMLQAYLYAQASAMVTNCVKTIPLSQTAGQQILYKSYGTLEAVLEKLDSMGEGDLYLSSPGFDIRSMQHECLYSRIYMS